MDLKKVVWPQMERNTLELTASNYNLNLQRRATENLQHNAQLTILDSITELLAQ